MGTYIVKAGDTLTAISSTLRGDPNAWRDIAASNALENPNRLQIGQQLEIEGYEPEQADIPEPTLNPRRDYSQSRGNAFGAPPPMAKTAVSPSPRAAGAEEIVEAIPEENRVAPRTDLTSALMDRLRQAQGVGPFSARPAEVAPNTPVSEPAYNDLSRREDFEISPTILPERPNITPEFDWAAAGAEFDPPTGAKIAQMMERFKERPELVDQVLQQLMSAEESY